MAAGAASGGAMCHVACAARVASGACVSPHPPDLIWSRSKGMLISCSSTVVALEISPAEVAQIRERQQGVLGEVGKILRLW